MFCCGKKEGSAVVKKIPIDVEWFGGDKKVWDRNSQHTDMAIVKRWFMSPPGFDDMLRDTYEQELEALLKAGKGQANICNILLLDQVTRNIYRK